MTKERDLIPVFVEGETITIQRSVNGKNVLMVVEIRDPCTLTPDRMTVNGVLKTWGESSYADERVARQARAIDRLLNHVQQHCIDPGNCDHNKREGEGT